MQINNVSAYMPKCAFFIHLFKAIPQLIDKHLGQIKIDKAFATFSKMTCLYLLTLFTEEYINVTVHRTSYDGTSKELLRTNGGPWGLSSVETAFTTWLTEVFGKDNINEWKDGCCDEYHDLMQSIKVKMRSIRFSLDETEKKTFSVGTLLSYTRKSSQDLTTHFSQMKLKENVAIVRNKVRVPTQIVRSWFDEPMNKGIRHIADVLAMPAMNDVDTILLVGEFAECPLVQETVEEAFRSKKIVIPSVPSCAVLLGAVLFGHQCNPMWKKYFK